MGGVEALVQELYRVEGKGGDRPRHVRSPEDYGLEAERRLAAKRADYFAAGTRAVWDVDLDGGNVKLHLAVDPGHAVVVPRGTYAHAEPVLPGWSMPVDDLFPAE